MAESDTGYSDARARMVENIVRLFEHTAAETGLRAPSDAVRSVMLEVPRHQFVPPKKRQSAYAGRPLEIGHGQTISQPYIVALMTELLRAKVSDRVLEIGTGSGYQTAVLSRLVAEVYTIEIVPALAREAAATLALLDYRNIHARIGDGYAGWPDAAPFDGILVAAAASDVPEALVAQLKPGGRMVLPVGRIEQDLMVITKDASGRSTSETIIAVRFVPLVRQ